MLVWIFSGILQKSNLMNSKTKPKYNDFNSCLKKLVSFNKYSNYNIFLRIKKSQIFNYKYYTKYYINTK